MQRLGTHPFFRVTTSSGKISGGENVVISVSLEYIPHALVQEVGGCVCAGSISPKHRIGSALLVFNPLGGNVLPAFWKRWRPQSLMTRWRKKKDTCPALQLLYAYNNTYNHSYNLLFNPTYFHAKHISIIIHTIMRTKHECNHDCT